MVQKSASLVIRIMTCAQHGANLHVKIGVVLGGGEHELEVRVTVTLLA